MFARIVLTVRDADNDTAPCSIRVSVDGATTIAEIAEDYAHVFADMIGNFLTGRYLDVKVELEPDTTGWANFNTPEVASDVEEKAVVKVRSAIDGTKPFTISIPTVYEGYFVNDGAGKILDITQADVLALYALLTEDIISGGLDCVDSHGTDLVQVISGEQSFKARKRR